MGDQLTNVTSATGKRKTAIARVIIKNGSGIITINQRTLDNYFTTQSTQNNVRRPFDVTHTLGQYDVVANISGGGMNAQSDALRHGIARALIIINAAFRDKLKREGYLTRDSRKKERKKPGQKGARKRFQFSKR